MGSLFPYREVMIGAEVHRILRKYRRVNLCGQKPVSQVAYQSSLLLPFAGMADRQALGAQAGMVTDLVWGCQWTGLDRIELRR